jgi:hypothetical protein
MRIIILLSCLGIGSRRQCDSGFAAALGARLPAEGQNDWQRLACQKRAGRSLFQIHSTIRSVSGTEMETSSDTPILVDEEQHGRLSSAEDFVTIGFNSGSIDAASEKTLASESKGLSSGDICDPSLESEPPYPPSINRGMSNAADAKETLVRDVKPSNASGFAGIFKSSPPDFHRYLSGNIHGRIH